MKRARAFIASLLPAERTHLLFLVGALLIFCAGAYAFSVPFEPPSIYTRTTNVGVVSRVVLGLIAIYSFFVAGLGAFAICFRAEERLVRRMLLFVVVPSVPGMLAMIVERYLEQPRGAHSVFESPTERLTGFLPSLWETIRYPSFGMCMWLVGLILLSVGVWRVTRRLNTLPVRFAPRPGQDSTFSLNEPDAGSLSTFLFTVLVLTQLMTLVSAPVLAFFPQDLSQTMQLKLVPLIGALLAVLPSLVPLLCAVWLLRVSQYSVLPGSLRRLGAMDAAVAVLVPAVVSFLPSLLIWGFQNLRWRLNPMSDYPALMTLTTANLNLWDLAFFLPAFAEELGWRCALQPVLTKRFGVRRGLLLVGLIWGFWHLPGNAGYFHNTVFAPLGPFARLLHTTLLGACLGWLFLRTKSIWPVTILHVASNLFGSWTYVFFPYELLKPPRGLVSWLLLAACVYLLFHFWPPAAEGHRETAHESTVPSRWARVKWPPQNDPPE